MIRAHSFESTAYTPTTPYDKFAWLSLDTGTPFGDTIETFWLSGIRWRVVRNTRSQKWVLNRWLVDSPNDLPFGGYEFDSCSAALVFCLMLTDKDDLEYW